MPWDVFEEDGSYCVHMIDAEKQPMGEAMKCYDNEADARQYVEALYANMPEGDMSAGKPKSKKNRDVEYKTLTAHGQQISDRLVTGIAAVTGNVDYGNDKIWPGAFTKTLKENKTRVRHVWLHNIDEPPTAAIRDLREVDKSELPADLLRQCPEAKGGLLVAREYLDTSRGNEVLAGIRAGAINEMSIGYKAIRKDFENQVRNLREVALLDTSDVMWGMNPASRAVKGALPFKASPMAAKDAEWDGPAEVAQASVDDLKAMCAWVNTDDAENKTGYKLPHHRADDGHTVVWRAVAAAMAALLGSRGGVDIPATDRRAVYNHLSQHYAQFDEEPPDFKLFSLWDSFHEIKQTFETLVAERSAGETKIGRMISAANVSKITAAIEALQAILQAAEPLNPEQMMEKALTVRRTFAQLDLLESEMQLEGIRAKHA